MKYFKYIVCFALLALVGTDVCAQDPVVDSLKLALKNARHDTSRVIILSKLSEVCEEDDILKYTQPCLSLAYKKIDQTTDKARIHFYLKYVAASIANNGYYAGQKGNVTKQLDCYKKALNINLEINDKQGIASLYNNLGTIYEHQGDISLALEYYHSSLKILEEINFEEGISACLGNVANIYRDFGDITKSLEYSERSLHIDEKNGNKPGIATTLANMGGAYEAKGDYKTASVFYFRALKINEEIKDYIGIASAYNNIAFLNFTRKLDINLAMIYFEKALKLREEISDKIGLVNTLKDMANANLSQGKLIEAVTYADRSLRLSMQLGFPKNILNAASTLKEIYKKQNKYKQALEMYELEIEMADSINNGKTRKAAIKKQFQYEYEKQAAADSVKHAEEQKVKNAQLAAQNASLKQERTQRYALYGGLVLVVCFSVFVFNRFKATQKQKKVIEEQKVMVDAAYHQLHEKNKEVMDSITYARRIQRALLTPESYIHRNLNKLANKS
ncbi:MAG: tetratricopeptide repeat protein [Bacteroidota bacterium]